MIGTKSYRLVEKTVVIVGTISYKHDESSGADSAITGTKWHQEVENLLKYLHQQRSARNRTSKWRKYFTCHQCTKSYQHGALYWGNPAAISMSAIH